jgi:N-acetylmuramoyl-L-alanine amidase
MSPFAIYLLKTIACSGILYAYYRIAFYNRASHQWNRFFLVASMAVSLILPLVSVYITADTTRAVSRIVRMLDVVTTNDVAGDDTVFARTNSFNLAWMLTAIYVIVSSALFFFLISSLVRIFKIYYSSPKIIFEHLEVVITQEKAAPFSFFKTIFWNTAFELNSSPGSRIFAHEKEHVSQLHTVDRLYINLLIIVFWCNPFFWLMRKELIQVHEFQADQRAIHDNNIHAFAEMVLLSAFPGKTFSITSTFFNSSIKRRLVMLTTFKNAKINLSGRWLLLPVTLILFAGFSLHKKEVVATRSAATFLLMIDAGHGGSANGVIAPDGTKEKDLNLSIARKIKALNASDRIKVFMAREGDEETPLQARVESAKKMGVNAFLSIHINNDESSHSGIQLMMTKNATQYDRNSQLLGSLLSQELSKVYKVDGELRKGRKDSSKGVWVLDAPEINYPSVLIECGNLNNSQDLDFIKSQENQEKIARQILNAVYQYAEGQ